MYNKIVEEFMKTAGQPVPERITQLGFDRGRLRLSLLLEELEELSVGLGMHMNFRQLMRNMLEKSVISKPASLIEQIDAYCDLQVVLSGAIIESGMQSIFDANFIRVGENNMEKFSNSIEEARATEIKYEKEGIETFSKAIGKYFVTYRKSDDKVLKSINWKPVTLTLTP